MEKGSKPNDLTGYEDTKWFANFFHLSYERIRQLSDIGVMPKKRVKGVNYYPTIKSIQNYIKYLQDITSGKKRTSEELEKEKLEAEIIYKKSKADLSVLELKQLQAKLLRAEDVQIFTENLAATIKSSLSALPGRLAMDVCNLTTAAEIEEIITDGVNEVLENLSQFEFDIEFYKERIRERHGKEVPNDGEDFDD